VADERQAEAVFVQAALKEVRDLEGQAATQGLDIETCSALVYYA
jgi:hypothetical protein